LTLHFPSEEVEEVLPLYPMVAERFHGSVLEEMTSAKQK
jgi:hypothetical protein